MLYKNTFVKIKKSFGRYFSLLMIVLIGSGFYAGLDASAPDIKILADTYYKDYNLTDFKVVSSLGLTDDDVHAIAEIDGVVNVVPSYSKDVLSHDKVIRVHAIEDDINKVKLTEGRMPTTSAECVADSRNYKLHDKIAITSDVEDDLAYTEYTVVGLAESVLYLAEDYGSSTIGNGKLTSFIFVDKSDFTMEVYTEIYVDAETGDTAAYSDEYNKISDRINDKLVELKPVREAARYNEILDDANAEIKENEDKLNDEKAKALKELADGKKELDDNAAKLSDGKETAIIEFADAKAELDDGMDKLNDGRKELADNEAKLNETVETQNAEFDEAKAKIADGYAQIDASLEGTDVTRENIGETIEQLTTGIQTMTEQLQVMPENDPRYSILTGTLTEYTKQLEGLKQLNTSIATLAESEKQLNDGIITFNKEISKARTEIADAKKEISENERKLIDGYAEYYAKLDEVDNELAENQQKLDDSYAEYYENEEKFNKEMADAEKKIADAKAELADIETAKWYISDRNTSVGHDELGTSIDVITSIAAVFPLFFILIVMLMSSNSMARMIAEERGELGTLTSLGYSDSKIIRTYLLYVLSASGIGAVAGFYIGCALIPPLVFMNFTYILPPLVMRYSMFTFACIIVVAFVLMVGVTIVSCNKELKQRPAVLMRPVPPKQGKKILLERIGFIWNHLSFTWKVTMRNMFRYKKRALMTIVGVAGCTALLLVGFGLRDSMNGVAEKQYGDIMRYKNMIILNDDVNEIGDELQNLLDNEHISEPLLLKQSAYKCEMKSKSLDTYLIIPQDMNMFEKYFNLTSKIDNMHITLDDNGVVVSQKLAAAVDVKKGDKISVKDTDNNIYDMIVADIFENYTSNYIFMSTAVYNNAFPKSCTFNTLVSASDADAKRLMDDDAVISVVHTEDVAQKILDNNKSLDAIIIFLVAVASLLAIIVLYNLTAINISERVREIATLKVLGFNDGETNAYIYREAIILTIVSIVLGMILGVVLHDFVVDIIESDTMVLFREIKLISFAGAGVLTIIFSVLMQFVTYFKLQKINMIESLKSVE